MRRGLADWLKCRAPWRQVTNPNWLIQGPARLRNRRLPGIRVVHLYNLAHLTSPDSPFPLRPSVSQFALTCPSFSTMMRAFQLRKLAACL